MTDFNFDYTKMDDDQGGFQPMADGIYDGHIEKSDVKQSKSGAMMIKLQLRLKNNRVLFDQISLNAANPKAKEIAQKKVKNIIVNGLAKTAEKKTTFSSLEDIASYIKGMPVKIKYQYKGKNPAGYDVEQLFYQPVEDNVRHLGLMSTTKGPKY